MQQVAQGDEGKFTAELNTLTITVEATATKRGIVVVAAASHYPPADAATPPST